MKLTEICRNKYFIKDGKVYSLFRIVKIAGGFIELECGWHNRPDDPVYSTVYKKEWLRTSIEEFLETEFCDYIDEAVERLKREQEG